MKQFAISTFQIGKNGLTEGTINSLKLSLKNHKQVRISVLKSATRNRTELISLAQKIKSQIPKSDYKIIGFTIILIKR
jgi:RNA-binding protein